MSDPIQPRPQPVVDAGNVAGNVLSVVTGLAGLLAILGTVTRWAWALGGAATLTAVAAGLSKFMPAIAAAGAAAQVTPLADPRDHLGKRLITDPEEYGRHAAPVSPDQIEQDEIDYWHSIGGATRYEPHRTDTQEIPVVTDGIHAHPTRKLGK